MNDATPVEETPPEAAVSPSVVLDVQDAAVDLSGRRVLHDVSVQVAAGELVGLIGPNGAGKTTLLRTVLGLLQPSLGRVRVNGRAAHPGRVPIGYVPQRHEFAWSFPVSVAEAVMSGRVHRIGPLRRPGVADWQAVREGLDLVRMREFAERPVGQLSGGQRQRVLVARALALRPSLLLLDEPFTGLDMPTQELLGELFVHLAHEGRAVLMTTHDIPSALTTSDRVVLLNRTVVAAGRPGDLVHDEQLWTRTFGVSADSAFIRILKAL